MPVEHAHSEGVMDAKWLLGSERQEHVLDHVAASTMDAKWLLCRAVKALFNVSGSTVVTKPK